MLCTLYECPRSQDEKEELLHRDLDIRNFYSQAPPNQAYSGRSTIKKEYGLVCHEAFSGHLRFSETGSYQAVRQTGFLKFTLYV